MSKEAVEWLRSHARRCQQQAISTESGMVEYHSRKSAPRSYEAELALQFADEIERLFVLDKGIETLRNPPRGNPPLSGVLIQRATTRRRGGNR